MQWNPQLYDTKHAFVSQFGEEVLELLAPRQGELILDIGCGTGRLTAKIAATGARAIGLDSSPAMIAQARSTYPTIHFLLADAADFKLEEPVDAIFSNAALHWVERAAEAVQCMARALRPGGRFVVEFGGHGNVEIILSALEQTLSDSQLSTEGLRNYFPSIAEYCTLLENYGIETVAAWLIDRPTRLEDGERGLETWLTMFRRSILDRFDADTRSAIMDEVKRRTRDQLYREGSWFADYRRLRIVGIKHECCVKA